MVASNTSNAAEKLSIFYSQILLPRKCNTNQKNTVANKPTPDRHLKVCSKDRRIRLPLGCVETVFKLNKALGHRNSGQTVEWLLTQAKSSVEDAIGPMVTQPPPPPPVARDPPHPRPILPCPTWVNVPPLATTIPAASNEFQSDPTVAGENEDCSSVSRPKPMGPSAEFGHNVDSTEVEISADEVAKFLYGSTELDACWEI